MGLPWWLYTGRPNRIRFSGHVFELGPFRALVDSGFHKSFCDFMRNGESWRLLAIVQWRGWTNCTTISLETFLAYASSASYILRANFCVWMGIVMHLRDTYIACWFWLRGGHLLCQQSGRWSVRWRLRNYIVLKSEVLQGRSGYRPHALHLSESRERRVCFSVH